MKKNLLAIGMMLAMVALALPLAYAQGEEVPVPTFPAHVDETTLSVIVAGGFVGALIYNVWGYNAKAKDEEWSIGKFGKTVVFSLVIGVPTAIGLTTLLEIEIDSLIKGFTLAVVVIAQTMGIEHARHTKK